MSGVYGDFLEAFPEITERVSVWTLPDKSDSRVVIGAFIPEHGSELKRRKYTSGNTGLDIVGEDSLYVYSAWMKSVAIGDYVSLVSKQGIHRVTDIIDFSASGGFFICKIQRVSGSTPDKGGLLHVKEGRY